MTHKITPRAAKIYKPEILVCPKCNSNLKYCYIRYKYWGKTFSFIFKDFIFVEFFIFIGLLFESTYLKI